MSDTVPDADTETQSAPTQLDTDSVAGELTDENETPSTVSDIDDSGGEQPETFPRSYVEELRQENGRYRQRAQQADQLSQRLHTELVRATGRLADPTDLPFDAAHLDDPDTLTAAIEELLSRKPHLANRRPVGDIGQGPMSVASANVDLAAILRQRAG